MPTRLAVILLAALAFIVSVWGYGRYQYSKGHTAAQTAAQIAAHEQYQADVERIAAASWELQNTITELQHAKPTIITQYRDRVVQAPLSDSCRIDADRLREIQSAVKAAAVAR